MAAPPERLEVLLGYACNNRCVFCSEAHNREEARARGRLARPTGKILALLRRTRRATPRYRHLTLLGGEPTVHAGFISVVREAFAAGFAELLVTTNGRMLAVPGFVDRVAACGPVTWCVSIHGPDARTHDGLTRAPGSFDQAVEGARRVVASGGTLFATTTVVRPNVDRLADGVRLLRSLRARHIHVAFARPMGAAAEDFDRLVPPFAAVPAAVRAAKAAAGRVPIRFANVPLCVLPPRQRHLADELHWSSPRKRTVVKPDAARRAECRFDDVAGRLKVHGPPCAACAAREACEGVWGFTAARRGFAGCRPLRTVPRRRRDGPGAP